MKDLVFCALCLFLFATVLQGCASRTAAPRTEKVDDRTIVARIRALISEDPALNAPAIRVFTVDGKVTLSGPVPNGQAKSRLLTGARGVPGVNLVSDNLELPTPP